MEYRNKMAHFSLIWNNFNDNMKSGFHDLLQTEDFVDVTIAVEGKLIQAHKMVLSVCSPYFKNIFKTNPCQHPIIFLKDVTHKELTGILQFMYLGEVSIQQEELGRFLKTAEALQIKCLSDEYSVAKEDSEENTSHGKPRNFLRNNIVMIKTELDEEEPSAKKLKLSSVNDIVKSSGQSSPMNKELEIQIDDSTIASKNESSELELSDVESDKMSLREDSVSVSESFSELSDNISDVRNGTSTYNHYLPMPRTAELNGERSAKNKLHARTYSKPTFGLEKLPRRNLRRCVVCSSKDTSSVRRSHLICSLCKKGVHGVCFGKHVCK